MRGRKRKNRRFISQGLRHCSKVPRISELAQQKESLISSFGGNPDIVRDNALIREYIAIGEQLKDYITDVSYEVNKAIEDDKKVLAEGAQGAHLDVIHGTQNLVVPVQILELDLPSWKEDLSQVKTYQDLPINAKKYVNKLEELIGVNIKYISVGPERDQIVRI